MTVGFRSPGALNVDEVPSMLQDLKHDTVKEPWFLRFSRFHSENGETGAHDVPHKPGGASQGEGIIVAHPDVGYQPHPELMHGAPQRIVNPRTFTQPVPSLFSTYAVEADFLNADFSIRNTWPDDGLDNLKGLNPSHGTSTGSTIMSMPGFPDPADDPQYIPKAIAKMSTDEIEPLVPQAIEGAAPKALLMPIRVADSVVVDPIVANNLTMGILHACETAMNDPDIGEDIGVMSISMGWPGGSRYQNYASLEKVLDLASRLGIVTCAAGAQSAAPIAPLLDKYADLAELIEGGAGTGADIALQTAELAAIAYAIAAFADLVFPDSFTPTSIQDIIDEVKTRAAQVGRTAVQIEEYLRQLERIAESHKDFGRGASDFVEGLVGYPGTSLNTICCAACDYKGNRMVDGFYGPKIDITAPGVSIHNAKVSGEASNPDYYTAIGSGTSYATAITAGACALWQAHHGRHILIRDYTRPLMIHLFRWALKRSSATSTLNAPGASWDSANRGVGILDAAALLQLDLPSSPRQLLDDLRNDGMLTDAQYALLESRAGLGATS